MMVWGLHQVMIKYDHLETGQVECRAAISAATEKENFTSFGAAFYQEEINGKVGHCNDLVPS